MKKLFLLSFMLLGLFCSKEAKADSANYYAKVTVDVAEDSKGLGIVYMEDSNGERVYEAEGRGSQIGADGATVGFQIFNEPADGYVLTHFTDQNGNEYRYDETGSTYIGVWAVSSDEADPTVFNLFGHFVEESSIPRGELAEVTVPADVRFGTFICPVATEISSELKAYRILAVRDDAVVLTPISSDILSAFTPVLLENTSMFDSTISQTFDPSELPEELPSLTDGLLTGVIEEAIVPMGSYVIEPGAEETGVFVRVGDEDTFMEPFTCFLTVGDTDAEQYRIDNLITAISQISNDAAETEIFDLQGRRLENLQQGVNIVNGIKIIVK